MTQQAHTVVRISERGAATRTALLAAARDVVTWVGFAEAGVTDIVTRAGASVGSLYRHFNGKADLYLVLFDDFQRDLTERTRRAVHRARTQGVCAPKELFLAGATAYLDGCIEERDLSRLFVSGDGPPGFDLIMRRRTHDWAMKNIEFFARSAEPVDEAGAIVLTRAMGMARAEVSLRHDPGPRMPLPDGGRPR